MSDLSWRMNLGASDLALVNRRIAQLCPLTGPNDVALQCPITLTTAGGDTKAGFEYCAPTAKALPYSSAVGKSVNTQNSTEINWKSLSEYEGGRHTTAYVPWGAVFVKQGDWVVVGDDGRLMHPSDDQKAAADSDEKARDSDIRALTADNLAEKAQETNAQNAADLRKKADIAKKKADADRTAADKAAAKVSRMPVRASADHEGKPFMTSGEHPVLAGPRKNGSGVTIGTGVDLGQKSVGKWDETMKQYKPKKSYAYQLHQEALAEAEAKKKAGELTQEQAQDLVQRRLIFIEKLNTHYVGKKRAVACAALREHPLVTTTDEAEFVDRQSKSYHLALTKRRYNSKVEALRKTGAEVDDFDDLPPSVQTALFSRTYQEGKASDVLVNAALKGDAMEFGATLRNLAKTSEYKRRLNAEANECIAEALKESDGTTDKRPYQSAPKTNTST